MMTTMGTLAIDHQITRDQHVWAFGPSMTPVLEVDPGAVIRLELNDCFSGQVTRRTDLFTSLDLERLNSATGPIAVRGAEPGDSLVVELLEINPGPRGAAMVIPGFGQLVGLVGAPVTRIFRVEDGTIHMNDRVRFPVRPMVGVIGCRHRAGRNASTSWPASTAATSTTTCTAPARSSTCRCASPAGCSRSATCTRAWGMARSRAPASRSRATS